MATATKSEVVNLVDHGELLRMFRGYVDQCIEDSNFFNRIHPLSFDEWYNREYKPNFETLTRVVFVTIHSETASGGYLCGGKSTSHCIRIPAEIISEGGDVLDRKRLAHFCKKFTDRMNFRLPMVYYGGNRVYSWTWQV